LIEPIVVMLAPLAPHFAEECWEQLHAGTAAKPPKACASVFDAKWPAFDAKLALTEEVEVAVQVNGKLRGRLMVPRGMGQQEVVDRAVADPAVKRFLDGKPIRKVVYVPDRLLNLVI
jgi:leucyl-tRNA synthetase